MVVRGMGLVVCGLMLVACGGGGSASVEPEPLSVEEYASELVEVSDPVNAFCLALTAKATTDVELPEMTRCVRDTSVPGMTAILMNWEDVALNAADNNLDGTDWVWAPQVAAADLFASGESSLSDVDVLFFALNDACQNTIEMPAAVAIQLGKGELTPEEALQQSDIYGNANC